MKSNNFKHAYALILLWLTFLWAVFCVWVTWKAVQIPTSAGIMGAAGVDTLLGALISWNALIIQHYFRKATPEDNPPNTTTTTTDTTISTPTSTPTTGAQK